MNNKYQKFDDVVSSFKKFIVTRKWPSAIHWVPHGGIIFLNKVMFIRVISAKKSERNARKAFIRGECNYPQLTIEGICCTPETTWVHLIPHLTEDDSRWEKNRALITKMSDSGKPVEVIFVTNILYWLILKLIGEKMENGNLQYK